MRTTIAVLSAATLVGAVGCTPRAPSRGATDERGATVSFPTDLLACQRGEEPRRALEARLAEPATSSTGPARARPADVTVVESHLASHMPRHGRALHRRLARVIHDESGRAGLDPLLVLALIRVESSFDPAAVSYAGAVGLMQLRELTMQEQLERSRLGPADPLDPIANVRAGIRYLQRLVSAFGSTELALMAYNAGPARIVAYRRAGGIPARFYEYPRRVRGELERLQRRNPLGGHPAAHAPFALERRRG